jgi:hypothetical protein
MSSLDLTRDWLKNVLRPYPSRDIVQTEVLRVLQRIPSLAVKTDAFSECEGGVGGAITRVTLHHHCIASYHSSTSTPTPAR